ncbi:MAG: hypothetical protein GXP35_07175 [Actinobacteria bacterium]|nr:hypothetical protein [Actinomycetota bacterium]
MSELLAHGIGARGDLPVDPGFLAWGAGLVLIVSFAALGALWTEPRLRAASERTRSIGSVPTRVVDLALLAGRLLAVAAYVLTIAAAFAGSRFAVLNPAPWVVFVAVWTAMPMLSFVFGDVWRHVSPLRMLGRAADLAGRRLGIHRPEVEIDARPAAIALFAFLWFELAYHDASSPRVLAWLIVVYSVWAVVPAMWFGVAWTDSADGLGWWFSKVASMAPWRRNDTIGARLPITGLSTVVMARGAVTSVLIVLGGATFDGFGRSSWWQDVVGSSFGWTLTLYSTVGLIWVIAIVGLVYMFASRFADRVEYIDATTAFAPSLIPIAFGYGIAHTFSLLVFEGQTLIIRISDPFGNGADWFGTNTWVENYTAVSTSLIAWVQVGAIIIGHLVGVIVAHDTALERYKTSDSALRSQYAMILAMIAYTVAGLLLLVNA